MTGRWVLCDSSGWRCEECGAIVRRIWKFFVGSTSRRHFCEECAGSLAEPAAPR